MDELPYGVDTIVLRMTWENPPRRPRARGRWDIAQGVRPWYSGAASPLAGGFDAHVVPVADKSGPSERLPGAPLAPSYRPSASSPDSGPPTLYPLAPGGTNEIPPYGARAEARGGGAPGGRRSLPASRMPPSTPAIPNPASPEQELRLWRELERSGKIESGDGNEAHHLVPQGGRGMRGQRDPSRPQAILRRFDIDLNSVENGAALSRGFHRRIHTNEYHAYVQRNLINFQTQE